MSVSFAAGLARGATNLSVPFLIETDTKMLVCVDRSTTPPTKELRCIAQIAHDLCTRHGMTEMNLMDHDLAPAMDEDRARARVSVKAYGAWPISCFL